MSRSGPETDRKLGAEYGRWKRHFKAGGADGVLGRMAAQFHMMMETEASSTTSELVSIF